MAAAVLVLPGATAAQDAPPAMCEVSAWSTLAGPNGLDIRAGPGPGFAVVGRLPPPIVLEGDRFAAQASITGAQDGWFRIDKGWLTDYSAEDDTDELAFEGEGWVPGDALGLWVEGMHLYGAPSHEAAVAADFSATRDGDYGPDYFRVERLLDCRGFWVEVEGVYFGERFRGWSDDVCSSQVTTCP